MDLDGKTARRLSDAKMMRVGRRDAEPQLVLIGPSSKERHEAADAERCRRLLDVAARLFVERGFLATTTDSIAAGAGISKKTLYRLFGSKLILFEALVQVRLYDLDILPDTDAGKGAQTERLSRLLLRMAHLLLNPDRMALVRIVLGEGRQAQDLSGVFARAHLHLDRDDDPLTRWMAAESAAGRLPAGIALEMARFAFDLTLAGPLLGALLGTSDDRTDTLVFASMIRQRVAIVLRALKSGAAPDSCRPQP